MRNPIDNETLYRTFLESVTYFKNGKKTHLTDKSINFRLSKIRVVQEALDDELDFIVANDDEMYKALIFLNEIEPTTHQPLQNALRKYYEFKNNKKFPKLKDLAL